MSRAHHGTHRVLVVIPTYEEAGNIDLILDRTLAAADRLSADVHVLVVDDNSPDGTGKLAERRAEEDPAVHVLHRAEKAGLGAAYIAGFDWAMERDYDVVVEMDADGSHAPEELHRLVDRLDAAGGADLVIGARWVPGGSVIGWSFRRRLLSRAANTYARLLLRIPLHDSTGGFRAYRTDVLRALPLRGIASQGYCFQVDMAWQAWRAEFRVVEVPISFTERQHGRSKMSAEIVMEALYRIFRWGLSARTGWLRRLIGYRPRSAGGG